MRYFAMVLFTPGVPAAERAEAAIVLAMACKDFALAQQTCIRMGAISQCLTQLNDPDPHLRQWLCLFLAEMWSNNLEAKGIALRYAGRSVAASRSGVVCRGRRPPDSEQRGMRSSLSIFFYRGGAGGGTGTMCSRGCSP